MNTQDAIQLGEEHATLLAAYNTPLCGDTHNGEVVTPENCRRIHLEACFEASEQSKQYSPFEFIANEFNDDENSDELWEAFSDAVISTIQRDVENTEFDSYVY